MFVFNQIEVFVKLMSIYFLLLTSYFIYFLSISGIQMRFASSDEQLFV